MQHLQLSQLKVKQMHIMDNVSLGKSLVVRPIVYSSILFPEITLTDLGMDLTNECVKHLF